MSEENKLGSSTKTVFASGNSIVSAVTFNNVKAKSLDMNLKGQPVSASGINDRQIPQADLVAVDGGILRADQITNSEFVGITYTASLGPPSPETEKITEDTLPQGPAEKIITEHKVEITDCLMADHHYILQHMQQEKVITKRKYNKLMEISQSEKSIIDLIDHMLDNGEESCSQFLEVLRKPEVLDNFPKLIEITKNWP